MKTPTRMPRDLKRRRSKDANNENNIDSVAAGMLAYIQSHVSSNNTGLKRIQSSIHSDDDSTPYSSLDDMDLRINAANKGNPIEQCALGDIYQHSKGGVSRDHFEAAKWYLRAANQGLAVAQCQLGSTYYDGKGISQSYQRSLEWYLKAADQGNVDAQDKLGEMYRKGKGVAQDYHKAIEWYLKAANQGSTTAQNTIGSLYGYGHGIPQDYGKAME
ncbi:hypothetical protein BGZ80_000851 [Entomortierella chlamydospora]|uniref:HCP-like protein n=1 Tax=Entomortierella chlamydospora TaxID=101097 RepID=A0A9P6SYQ1_9FUNG|nr:hypothetical protein BGZ80_000851 [Entomortierella chlamydospora]